MELTQIEYESDATMSISLSHLKIVYKATFEARNEWKNILLELDVSSTISDSIGETWKNDPANCYREGLKVWLKEERSWEDLVEALSSPTVGHSAIAQTIVKKFVKSGGGTASIDIPEFKKESAAHGTSPSPNHQKINERLVIFSDNKIGFGAFGMVFKGSYRSTPCAVKVLHELATQIQTDLPAGEGNESAFDRECKFVETFQHPNVVQHLSTDKHPKSSGLILVTELMDCNLKSYLSGIDGETLTTHFQLSLSRDVASGLAYIHSRKVIHRDLCGDNILLSLALKNQVPLAKISDFGMSRLLDPSQMTHTLTVIPQRMGYLPPEALRQENELYDHKLDVFSLGVIMLQIVRKLETVKTPKERTFHESQIPTEHELKLVISDCLQEDSRKRPTAQCISDLLCEKQVPLSELEKDKVYFGLEKAIKKRNSPPPLEEAPDRPHNPPKELKPESFTLKWTRGKDMPIKMGSYIPSVVIGDSVYVGGGRADNDHDMRTVMKFSKQVWTKLPQYQTKKFAMTTIANHLVVVGGFDLKKQEQTDLIAEFKSESWTYPYPPMEIACRSSTAVSFDKYIIVAGGRGNEFEGEPIASVQVLDISIKKWYIAESLPSPHSSLKSAIIRSTLYIMGGVNPTENPTMGSPINLAMHEVDLNELITKAKSKHIEQNLWKKRGNTPVKHCIPFNFGGSLFAVGGCDDNFNPDSSIHLYQNDSKRWVKVGDLPTPRFCCTCSVLNHSGEVIVAGGQTGWSKYCNTVDIMTVQS